MKQKDTAATVFPARLLIVDDEEIIRRGLERLLTGDGYLCTTAATADEAWSCLEGEGFALVVLDMVLPDATGFDLLELLRKRFPETVVVVVTALDDRDLAIRAVQMGAHGYVVKPFGRDELLVQVAGALHHRDLVLANRQHQMKLEAEVKRHTERAGISQREVILRLVAAQRFRHDETATHIRRMGAYCEAIACSLGYSEERQTLIGLAATMHDVGKIGIPDSILTKPGKLTESEFEVMKSHAEIGKCILEGSEISLVMMAERIAHCHHEKWDGTGYPQGLRGGQIPQFARIVAVADVFDALSHERVYKPAFSEEDSLAMMKEQEGRHFDPRVLQAFFAALPEIRKVRERFPEPPVTQTGPVSQSV